MSKRPPKGYDKKNIEWLISWSLYILERKERHFLCPFFAPVFHLSWVTHYFAGGRADCGFVNIDCYTGVGKFYNGKADTTMDGEECEPWNVQEHNKKLRFMKHNRCTNPICKRLPPRSFGPRLDTVPCDPKKEVGIIKSYIFAKIGPCTNCCIW